MDRPRTRLLVVDDSNFVRVALRLMLEQVSDIEVVGEARNGAEALRLTRKLKPDVIAMDLNMPVMDGIEAVQAIAREKGPPCIMVSNETSDGAVATIRALEAGAVDFVCKNTSFVRFDMASIERQLIDKVRHWGRWRQNRGWGEAALPVPCEPASPSFPVSPVAVPGSAPDLLAIGVSTGGPVTLVELLSALGPVPCPVAVAQHMPASFTAGFAASLARTLKRPVVEGSDGSRLENGVVTILKGGGDCAVHRLAGGQAGGGFVLRAGTAGGSVYHPSADLLFRSAAEAAASPVAVILTGMGDDGSAGAMALAARGLPILVQDPATCAVDGMPRSAIRAGVATEILPVAALAARLKSFFDTRNDKQAR